MSKCINCDGTGKGMDKHLRPAACPACDGSGKVTACPASVAGAEDPDELPVELDAEVYGLDGDWADVTAKVSVGSEPFGIASVTVTKLEGKSAKADARARDGKDWNKRGVPWDLNIPTLHVEADSIDKAIGDSMRALAAQARNRAGLYRDTATRLDRYADALDAYAATVGEGGGEDG